MTVPAGENRVLQRPLEEPWTPLPSRQMFQASGVSSGIGLCNTQPLVGVEIVPFIGCFVSGVSW